MHTLPNESSSSYFFEKFSPDTESTTDREPLSSRWKKFLIVSFSCGELLSDEEQKYAIAVIIIFLKGCFRRVWETCFKYIYIYT